MNPQPASSAPSVSHDEDRREREHRADGGERDDDPGRHRRRHRVLAQEPDPVADVSPDPREVQPTGELRRRRRDRDAADHRGREHERGGVEEQRHRLVVSLEERDRVAEERVQADEHGEDDPAEWEGAVRRDQRDRVRVRELAPRHEVRAATRHGPAPTRGRGIRSRRTGRRSPTGGRRRPSPRTSARGTMSAMIMIRLRSSRSTSVPAIGPNSTAGSVRASIRPATEKAALPAPPARSATSVATARNPTQSPERRDGHRREQPREGRLRQEILRASPIGCRGALRPLRRRSPRLRVLAGCDRLRFGCRSLHGDLIVRRRRSSWPPSHSWRSSSWPRSTSSSPLPSSWRSSSS